MVALRLHKGAGEQSPKGVGFWEEISNWQRDCTSTNILPRIQSRHRYRCTKSCAIFMQPPLRRMATIFQAASRLRS